MSIVTGNPFADAWHIVLYSVTPFGLVVVHAFGVLHHTLRGCVALARVIDTVTPYLVGCVGS